MKINIITRTRKITKIIEIAIIRVLFLGYIGNFAPAEEHITDPETLGPASKLQPMVFISLREVVQSPRTVLFAHFYLIPIRG